MNKGLFEKETYVIDAGSANVTVYRDGLLLREPSVALVQKGVNLTLRAAGQQCYQMDGTNDVSFVRPIMEGAIINTDVAGLMLEDFFRRVIQKRLPMPECYALVSAGLSLAERDSVETAMRKGGLKNVTLVESVLSLLPFVDSRGSLVIICGSGTTEIGIIGDEGILNACAVNIGGSTINQKICEVLSEDNFSIGLKTAERLKIELGSLNERESAHMEAVGKDILDGKLRSRNVTAEEIRPSIAMCYKKVLEVAESLITTLPQHVASQVTRRPVYFAGGGAEMRGLKEFTKRMIGLEAEILPHPEYICSVGLYRMIQEKEKYPKALPFA